EAGDTTNFGSLNVTGGVVTITENSATVSTGSMSAASRPLTSSATITDAASTTFAVSGLATFSAGGNAITLGDDAGDTTNFGSLKIGSAACRETEDSATVVTGTNTATSLTLTASGTITNAPRTTCP